MRKSLVLLSVLVALALGAIPQDAYQMMATVEAGHAVPSSDPLVAAFRLHVNSIAGKVENPSRMDIGDKIMVCKEQCKKRGKEIGLLEATMAIDRHPAVFENSYPSQA